MKNTLQVAMGLIYIHQKVDLVNPLSFGNGGIKLKEQMVAVLFSLISIGWTINLGVSTFCYKYGWPIYES